MHTKKSAKKDLVHEIYVMARKTSEAQAQDFQKALISLSLMYFSSM